MLLKKKSYIGISDEWKLIESHLGCLTGTHSEYRAKKTIEGLKKIVKEAGGSAFRPLVKIDENVRIYAACRKKPEDGFGFKWELSPSEK